MKPPINRNDDGKSIASRKNDENMSRTGSRWMGREDRPPVDSGKEREVGTVSFA